MNNQFYPVRRLRKNLTYKDAQKLYEIHKDKSFYEDLCKYMSSGDSIGYTLRYDGNSKNIIKLSDEIKKDIRKSFGKDDMRNTLHSSDDIDNVKRESLIYFKN